MDQEQIETLKIALDIKLDNKNKAVNMLNSLATLHDIYINNETGTHILLSAKLDGTDTIILNLNTI